MTRRLLFAALLAFGIGYGQIKVLVITGGHPFEPGPFFKLFQDNPEIAYTAATQDKAAEAYDRPDLFTYNVLVLYDSPVNMTEPQRDRFLELFDRGIGVVILHHAFLSYPMWLEYGRIAGGKYVYTKEQEDSGLASSHYQGGVDIPVTVVGGDHPVTAGLKDFTVKDELYTNMHMLDGNTPLLKTGDELLAWARTEKKSRVVGIIIGHGPTAYENPNFQKLLAQTIRWVAQR